MLLQQTVLPRQLVMVETFTAWVTLPIGCALCRVTCNIDPADFAAAKSLALHGQLSLDGGATVLASDSMQWVGPDPGILPPSGVPGKFGFAVPCVGFGGAMIRGRLLPGPEGITTDLAVEVD